MMICKLFIGLMLDIKKDILYRMQSVVHNAGTLVTVLPLTNNGGLSKFFHYCTQK